MRTTSSRLRRSLHLAKTRGVCKTCWGGGDPNPACTPLLHYLLLSARSPWSENFHVRGDAAAAAACLQRKEDCLSCMRLPRLGADSVQFDSCRRSDFKSGYQQWVDRSYLEIQTPSIDWQVWFDGIGFPTAGLEETGDEEEVDDDGQPYGIPRLIMAQGDYPETIEDILSCKGTGGEDIEQEQCWARIRSYMRFKIMQYYAPYLDDQFQDALQDW